LGCIETRRTKSDRVTASKYSRRDQPATVRKQQSAMAQALSHAVALARREAAIAPGSRALYQIVYTAQKQVRRQQDAARLLAPVVAALPLAVAPPRQHHSLGQYG